MKEGILDYAAMISKRWLSYQVFSDPNFLQEGKSFLWSQIHLDKSYPERHSPFYSAPSILAIFRNLVREIWFEKSGSANSDFFSGSRKVMARKKKVRLYYKSTFFRLEKSGSANSDFFSGSRKVVDLKKKS